MKIENICNLMILNIASNSIIGSSFIFRNIFLNSLGIIEDEGFLIKNLEENRFVTHDGSFENSNFYKSVSTIEKGKEYFNNQIKNIEIPQGEFSEERQKLLRKYLGLNDI